MIKSILITIFLLGATMNSSAKSATENNNPRVMTQGLSHLGLSVTKLDQTAAFFIETLGWRLAGEKPAYPAKFVTDGKMFVTLWQVNDVGRAIPFDRKNNVGLHHLALAVSSIEDLEELHQRFQHVDGVVIEFGPELNGQGPTMHMMIREPSGNRIEFAYKP